MAEDKGLTLYTDGVGNLTVKDGLKYKSGGGACASCGDNDSKQNPAVLNIAIVNVSVNVKYNIQMESNTDSSWVKVSKGVMYKITGKTKTWQKPENTATTAQMKAWFPNIDDDAAQNAYDKIYSAVEQQRKTKLNKSIEDYINHGKAKNNLVFASQKFVDKFMKVSTYKEWNNRTSEKEFDVDIKVLVNIRPQNFSICKKLNSNDPVEFDEKACTTVSSEIKDDGGYELSISPDDYIKDSGLYPNYVDSSNYAKLNSGNWINPTYLRSQIEPGIQQAIINSRATGEPQKLSYVFPLGGSVNVPGVVKVTVRGGGMIGVAVSCAFGSTIGVDGSVGPFISNTSIVIDAGTPALWAMIATIFNGTATQIIASAANVDGTPNVIPSTPDGTGGNLMPLPPVPPAPGTPVYRPGTSEPGSANPGTGSGNQLRPGNEAPPEGVDPGATPDPKPR
jgi:hypothetical protein